MKNIAMSQIKPFDVLLYPRKKLWIKYFHCAWYVGKVWGMRTNYESTEHGPELEEWREGNYPQYVCRLKKPLTEDQRAALIITCRVLKDKKYDTLSYLTEPLRKFKMAINIPDRIRCDECITMPLEAAGIKLELKEMRPRAFLESPAFDVYETKRKGGE